MPSLKLKLKLSNKKIEANQASQFCNCSRKLLCGCSFGYWLTQLSEQGVRFYLPLHSYVSALIENLLESWIEQQEA